MTKVLIFGNGQIANFYIDHFKNSETIAVVAEADITNKDQIKNAIDEFEPTVVINTAAKTNLEWCGIHRLESFDVNVLGAGNIAEACDNAGVYFIHFSSGCIFSSTDGTDAKDEEALPNPSSYY